MSELRCEYLYLRCIWLYGTIVSRTSSGINPDSAACLNVKELLARSKHHIWTSSDSNEIRTDSHLVRKPRLNHLAKLVKWLSRLLGTYLYGAFDYMLLSCHVRVSELIDTL